MKTLVTGVWGTALVLWGAGWALATLQEVPSAGTRAGEEVITLKIEGWTCGSCARYIRRALVGVPGVKGVEVSYARGGAIVTVEPGHVTAEQLIRAVERASPLIPFRATVIPNGSLPAEEAEHSDGGLKRLFR
ncbi:heavy-metal-associated domain-containing protein [Nitrospira sp. Kam-Ns4a]